jgi:hypothetical protein
VPYYILNSIGLGLAHGMPSGYAFTYIMLETGNPWLAGHQLAQVFSYKWLHSLGFSPIELEYNMPNSAKRADILALRGSMLYMFELKHFPIDRMKYNNINNPNRAAKKQLDSYYELLGCNINKEIYSLVYWTANGNASYELFKIGDVSCNINLRHSGIPGGVIDYWFSIKNKKEQSERQISPSEAISYYQNINTLKLQQEMLHGRLPNYDPKTVFYITAGVLVGTTIVGVTVAVTGPVIASWVASTATSVSVSIPSAVSGVLYVAYKAGEAIKQIIDVPRASSILALPGY